MNAESGYNNGHDQQDISPEGEAAQVKEIVDKAHEIARTEGRSIENFASSVIEFFRLKLGVSKGNELLPRIIDRLSQMSTVDELESEVEKIRSELHDAVGDMEPLISDPNPFPMYRGRQIDVVIDQTAQTIFEGARAVLVQRTQEAERLAEKARKQAEEAVWNETKKEVFNKVIDLGDREIEGSTIALRGNPRSFTMPWEPDIFWSGKTPHVHIRPEAVIVLPHRADSSERRELIDTVADLLRRSKFRPEIDDDGVITVDMTQGNLPPRLPLDQFLQLPDRTSIEDLIEKAGQERGAAYAELMKWRLRDIELTVETVLRKRAYQDL